MRTIAQEIGVGYIAFNSDFSAVVKDTKELVDATKKAHQQMQKDVDKTVSAFKRMEKAGNAMGNGIRKAFSLAVNSVRLFGGIIKTTVGILGSIINVLKNFVQMLGKGIAGAVNIAIRAVTKLITVLASLVKFMSRALMSVLRLPHTIGEALDNLTKKFVFLQLDIRYIIDQFKKVFLTVGAITAGASAVLTSYEDAFVRVRKVVDMTEDSLSHLSDNIEKLSTRVVTSAKALTELTAVGGQLGIEGVSNLTRFTEVMAKLQMTTNIAGEEGAAQFSRLMNIMGVSQEYMENMGSTMVHLGNNFAAFENEILAMSFKLAGAGKAVGMTTQEVLGLATALSAAGVRAERGGSAVSRVMLEMANAAFSGGKELENFAKIIGLTTEQMEEMIKNTPILAIEKFIKGLQRIDEQGGNVFQALEDVNVSQIRTRDVILRLVAAQDLLGSSVDQANTAWKENSALTDEVNTRNKTLWAQLLMLKNQALKFAKTIGELYQKNLKGFVGILRVLNDVLNNLDQEQLNTIKDILTLIALISGAVTALTMLVKAFFTFMTGLTLIARFVVFVLPIVGLLLVLKNVLDEIGMSPLEGVVVAFRTLKEIISATVQLSKDLWEAWQNTILAHDMSQTLDDLTKDLQRISEIEGVSLGIKFTWSMKSITQAALDMVKHIRASIRRAIERMKSPDVDIAKEITEDTLSWGKLDRQGGYFTQEEEMEVIGTNLIKIGKNIAEFLKEGLKLVFIDLPVMLYTFFKESEGMKNLRDLVASTFNDGWEEFKRKSRVGELWVQEKSAGYQTEDGDWVDGWMADIIKTIEHITDLIDGLTDEEGNIDIGMGEGWKEFKSWWGDFYSGFFKDEKQKQEFKDAITELWETLVETLSQFFADTLSKVLKAIDWHGIFVKMFTGLWGAIGKVLKLDTLKDAFGLSGNFSVNKRENWVQEDFGFIIDWLRSINPLPFQIQKDSEGTILAGYGGGDQIPALLERGEAVIPKEAVRGGMSGVAQWFKSMGAPGFQQGALPKSLSIEQYKFAESISDVTGLNQEMILNLMSSMEDLMDTFFEKLAKLVDTIMKGISAFVDAVFDFAKLFVNEDLYDKIEEYRIKTQSVLTGFQNTLEDWFTPQEETLEDIKEIQNSHMFLTRQEIELLNTFKNSSQKQETLLEKMDRHLENIVTRLEGIANPLSDLIDINTAMSGYTSEEASKAQELLSRIGSMSEMADKFEESTTELQEGLSEVFGTTLSRYLTAAVAGYAGSQSPTGTNYAGAGMNAASSLGLIHPLFAVGAQIIGSMMPHDEVSGEYKDLRNQTESVNEALNKFGHSFDVTNPQVKDVTSWIQKLFGGRELEYSGMDKAEAELEIGKEILQQLNQILSQVSSNVRNAFSAENTDAFVTNLKQSLWNTIKNALITALMQSEMIQELLMPLTAMIQEFTADYELSSDEYDKLQKEIEDIATVLEPFYEEFAELTETVDETEESMNKLNDALYNVPTGFKIAQARFDAASAITVAEGGSGHTIVIEGDIYGFEDFKEKVLIAQREGDMDLTISRYGT